MAADPRHALAPGDLLDSDVGALVIEAAVGAGGSAVVYRARRAEGARVAVKVLAAGGTDWARVTRERSLLADVEHPGVIRVLGAGDTDDGARFVVLPWLDGVSLADRLVEPGVTAREAVAAIAGAAAALGAAHHRGVVHRDVKPGHVWCTGGGGVAVIDFGIARGRGDARVTRTGATGGTPGYMAPVPISGGAVDARADVFALGCVLYEALTGAPAFAGSHPAILRGKVLWSEPRPVAQRCPEAGAGYAALVETMLAKDPEARPADGATVAAAMAALPAPGDGPRRRTGHVEAETCPMDAVRLVAVGLALDQAVVPAAAPSITLDDNSAIALAPDAGAHGFAAAAAALAAALGPGRAVAIARTRDVDRGLVWCTRAATLAAASSSAPAAVLSDLTRNDP
jgi:hypothetical protein